MRIRRQAERLSVPKVEYIPKNPFKFSDFRGLLTADFTEALVSAFDQETLDKVNDNSKKEKEKKSPDN